MSAVVSPGLGALFLTETGTRAASLAGAFLSETVAGGGPVALAGDLAPSVTFAADLTTGAVSYVDFAGNIGGSSAYGKLGYGVKKYSRVVAFTPEFDGDFDIVGSDLYEGDLSPVVTFAGALSLLMDLGQGDLAPSVAFGGTLTGVTLFAGDLPVQIDLEGLLTGEASLQGDLPVQIDLNASTLTSGPLWAPKPPGANPWAPSTPCPPPMWTPDDPCAPADWEETEPCNG